MAEKAERETMAVDEAQEAMIIVTDPWDFGTLHGVGPFSVTGVKFTTTARSFVRSNASAASHDLFKRAAAWRGWHLIGTIQFEVGAGKR